MNIADLGCDVTPDEQAYAERVVTLGRGTGKHNTMCLAKRCIKEGIPGDFVETGVNMGGHPALMAWISRKYGDVRTVHMYDSFEGVPRAGVHDSPEWQEIMGVCPPDEPEPCGRIVNPIDAVRENMVKWDVADHPMVYHVGWLQKVLPVETNTPKSIALLRIDVDLYDSTVPVMEYLYPRVSRGGYIISDDWGEGEGMAPCREAMFQYFDRMEIPRPQVTRIPETPGTVWFQKP